MASELHEVDFKALNRIDVTVRELTDVAAWSPSPEPGGELHHDDQTTAPPGYASSLVSSAMYTALCGFPGFQALCKGVGRLQRSTTLGYVHRAAIRGACEAYWFLRSDDRDERVRPSKQHTRARGRVGTGGPTTHR